MPCCELLKELACDVMYNNPGNHSPRCQVRPGWEQVSATKVKSGWAIVQNLRVVRQSAKTLPQNSPFWGTALVLNSMLQFATIAARRKTASGEFKHTVHFQGAVHLFAWVFAEKLEYKG